MSALIAPQEGEGKRRAAALDEDADGLVLLQSSVKNVFIRGSVVRYVHLPGAAVDTALLEDATRRGMLSPAISWLVGRAD